MKKITINSNAFGSHDVLIDDADFELVSRLSWMLLRGRTGILYAVARHYYGENHRKTISMHRLIMGEHLRSVKIDHVDGNGINNQKHNLRRSTNSQNLCNRGKSRINTTGFKGVSPLKNRTKKFQSQIQVNNKSIHIGYFHTSIEAAFEWNKASRLYHGDFAYQNPVTAIKYSDGTMYTHEVRTPCITPIRDKDFIIERVRTFVPC